MINCCLLFFLSPSILGNIYEQSDLLFPVQSEEMYWKRRSFVRFLLNKFCFEKKKPLFKHCFVCHSSNWNSESCVICFQHQYVQLFSLVTRFTLLNIQNIRSSFGNSFYVKTLMILHTFLISHFSFFFHFLLPYYLSVCFTTRQSINNPVSPALKCYPFIVPNKNQFQFSSFFW